MKSDHGNKPKPEWRVLQDLPQSGSRNMAVDYAILKAVSAGEQPPTLRLYRWAQPTITIGYFQSPEKEVYLDEAEKQGVKVIRRITGGGTVFHHLELTYSFIIPAEHPAIKGEVLDSFRTVCNPIIKALNAKGIPAEYQPINDITAGGKKISGNAQIRKEGVLLQHGTILLDIHLESIRSLLTGAGSNKQHIIDQDSGEKVIKEVNHVTRVGSLSDFINDRALSDSFREEIEAEIINSFADAFGVELEAAPLSSMEEESAIYIEEKQFRSEIWNRGRERN